MSSREDTLNHLLVWLMKDIMEIEEKFLISGEFKDITNNDMHVIEAIGLDGHKKMTDIAKTLSVTTGTLTKSMDGLVRKQYVNRNRSEEDKRVVLISLTEKGVRAFHHHENFHKILIKRATRGMSEEEICFLINILAKLKDSFRLNFKIGEMVNDMLQD
ncbi:MAG: winged helix DNA-binding protein [Lachnospiraceae bacterium]|uniref:transcriptional regulator, SarA/Rot family n=1 Tax=Roseburia hominis TaxID=301301 RepID=UPI001F413454|nr:winged helix DNA-binding protein [Roseburia hominis]MDD6169284.1 winged helix DNA-binding protein [Lachnospiraceae bacterium]MDY4838832.1 winged helix DNA-binding protein [Lachnospiraceae bacterium]MEE1250608.1 winged helix DNA-binding protein [Lachnospiraceae bacterium]